LCFFIITGFDKDREKCSPITNPPSPLKEGLNPANILISIGFGTPFRGCCEAAGVLPFQWSRGVFSG